MHRCTPYLVHFWVNEDPSIQNLGLSKAMRYKAFCNQVDYLNHASRFLHFRESKVWLVLHFMSVSIAMTACHWACDHLLMGGVRLKNSGFTMQFTRFASINGLLFLSCTNRSSVSFRFFEHPIH
eukprot:scaffold217_cov341-Pavlova_lutheri.AAC.4